MLGVRDAVALPERVTLRKMLADEFGVDRAIDDDLRHMIRSQEMWLGWAEAVRAIVDSVGLDGAI